MSSGGAAGPSAAFDRARSHRATPSASVSSAATSRSAAPARSPPSTAIASTLSAIRSTTSGRPVPDDARVGPHAAPKPDVVVEAGQPGRGDRHDRAGSRDGDCRHARRRAVDAADTPGARYRSRSKPHVQVPVVRDQLFTPLLTYLSVVNTLKSYEREFGAASFMVKGRALVDKHGEIAFEDIFTGDSPSIGAASYIAGPITFLLKNDFEPVEIERARPRPSSSSEQPRTAVARARVARRAGRAAGPRGAAEAPDAHGRRRRRARTRSTWTCPPTPRTAHRHGR